MVAKKPGRGWGPTPECKTRFPTGRGGGDVGEAGFAIELAALTCDREGGGGGDRGLSKGRELGLCAFKITGKELYMAKPTACQHGAIRCRYGSHRRQGIPSEAVKVRERMGSSAVEADQPSKTNRVWDADTVYVSGIRSAGRAVATPSTTRVLAIGPG